MQPRYLGWMDGACEEKRAEEGGRRQQQVVSEEEEEEGGRGRVADSGDANAPLLVELPPHVDPAPNVGGRVAQPPRALLALELRGEDVGGASHRCY